MNRHAREPLDPINSIPKPDYNAPQMDDMRLLLNDVKWNTWMNVLARCPICEEGGVLKEIDALNKEFEEVWTKVRKDT